MLDHSENISNKQNKIKLVFLLNSFKVGGIERQFLLHARTYDPARYEIHLITLYNYPEWDTLYAELPEHITVHQCHFTLARANVREIWRLGRLLRSVQPDIVFSSMFGPNTLNRFWSLFIDYVPIAREHNTYVDRGVVQRCIDHLLAYRSPVIVAVSKRVADFAAQQARIPREKFVVINNGIDMTAIAEAETKREHEVQRLRAEFALAPTQRVWLNVARLKPQKNHSLLLNAFAAYQRTHPDDVLFIVGDGSARAELATEIEQLGLQDRVFLVGYRTDVFAFYQLADYFILTSHIEGFPNVVLEAMAFGLPVLSTPVAGIDEVIRDGENGYVLPYDTAAVCAKMATLSQCSQSEQLELSKEAYHSAQLFTVEQIVADYEKLIFKLSHA